MNARNKRSAADRVLDSGYEDVLLFENFSYDDALIGVSEDGRAVYDFDKMVAWLMEEEGWTMDDATEWVEYNTIRAIPYMGPGAPIVIYTIE